MAGNDFIGHQPSNIQFRPSSVIKFDLKTKDGKQTTKCSYSIEGFTKVISSQFAGKSPIEHNGRMLYNKSGTISYYKTPLGLVVDSKNEVKLIYSNSDYYQPIKVLDNNRILIKTRGVYFVLDRKFGSFIQLINFIKKRNPIPIERNYLERQTV